MGRFFTVPLEPTQMGQLSRLIHHGDRLILNNAEYIINVIGPSEEIEDSRTLDTVILSQIQIVSDLSDDLSLAQHMAIMLTVFQAVYVCLYFHDPPHYYFGKGRLGCCSVIVLSSAGTSIVVMGNTSQLPFSPNT